MYGIATPKGSGDGTRCLWPFWSSSSKTSIISSIMLFRYGIATPKGSRWRDPLSLAILELQEKGTIQMLYNKWWKNTGDVCTRQVTLFIYYIRFFCVFINVADLGWLPWIPDPDFYPSRIPDPRTATKGRKNETSCPTFFVATNIIKLKNI
jgi:hypothetical protein